MAITTFSTANMVRDFDPMLKLIPQISTPFMDLVSTSGTPLTSTKYFWWDDVKKPVQTTLTAGYTQSTASGVFTVASSVGLKVGSIINIEGQIKKVTVIGSTTSITTAHVGGSADADVASGKVVYYLGNADKQGQDLVETDYTSKVERYNVTQIFSDSVVVSDTALATKRETGEDIIAEEILKKLAVLKVGMNRAFLNSVRVVASDNTTPNISGGLLYYIGANGYNPSAANPYSTQGSDLDNLDAFVLEMVNNKGAQPAQLLMNPSELGNFVALGVARLIKQYDDTTIGRTVNRYITKYGHELSLITDAAMPVKKIAMLDMNQIKIEALRQFKTTEIGKTGDNTKYNIVGEYTLEVANSATMGVFTCS